MVLAIESSFQVADLVLLKLQPYHQISLGQKQIQKFIEDVKFSPTISWKTLLSHGGHRLCDIRKSTVFIEVAGMVGRPYQDNLYLTKAFFI